MLGQGCLRAFFWRTLYFHLNGERDLLCLRNESPHLPVWSPDVSVALCVLLKKLCLCCDIVHHLSGIQMTGVSKIRGGTKKHIKKKNT